MCDGKLKVKNIVMNTWEINNMLSGQEDILRVVDIKITTGHYPWRGVN